MIKPPTIRYPLAASCPKMVVSQSEPPKNHQLVGWFKSSTSQIHGKTYVQPKLGGFVLLGILYIFLVEGFCGWYGGTSNEPHHEMCDVNIADFHAESLRSASHNKSQEMQNKKEIHQGLLGAPTDWWYPAQQQNAWCFVRFGLTSKDMFYIIEPWQEKTVNSVKNPELTDPPMSLWRRRWQPTKKNTTNKEAATLDEKEFLIARNSKKYVPFSSIFGSV